MFVPFAFETLGIITADIAEFLSEVGRRIQGRQSWGWGSRPPDFWQGGCRGLWTGREILLLSYHVEEVWSKMVTFEEK